MTEAWTSKPLEEFSRFRNGKSIKPGTSGKYPVYGSNGLIGTADEFMYEAAVILGRVGAYCGSVELSEGRLWASDNTIVVEAKPDDADLWFLYYLLKDANLNQHAGGAAQPLLTQSRLKPLQFSIPPLPIQRRIAAALRNYDDLIENNTRRIEILEEMARRLYEEWFVHFRFPGHKEVSFKESELGRIPEGWDWQLIGEIYKTSSGGTPSRKQPEYYGEDFRWLKTKELRDGPIFETEERISEIGLKKSSAKLFPKNTVVIAMYGATIGRLGVLREEAATNQACCAILPEGDSGWTFAYLSLLHRRKDIIDLRAGAAQQNVSQAIIKQLPVLIAPHLLQNQFEELVKPLLELSYTLHRKNTNLRAQRGLLLPKLVSGVIDVSDIPMPGDREVAVA